MFSPTFPEPGSRHEGKSHTPQGGGREVRSANPRARWAGALDSPAPGTDPRPGRRRSPTAPLGTRRRLRDRPARWACSVAGRRARESEACAPPPPRSRPGRTESARDSLQRRPGGGGAGPAPDPSPSRSPGPAGRGARSPAPPQGRGRPRLASAGRGETAAAAASLPPARAGPCPGAVGHGAVEAVRAVAHPLQGAARQPPCDLGLGAGVRPGADPPRWSPALPAAQQSPGALHQPEGDQPEAADVPGKGAGAGALPPAGISY